LELLPGRFVAQSVQYDGTRQARDDEWLLRLGGPDARHTRDQNKKKTKNEAMRTAVLQGVPGAEGRGRRRAHRRRESR
jgi:hypothetical protein